MEFDVLYNENAKAEEVVAAIRRTLIQRLGKEDFTITTQQQMLDVLGSVLNMLTAAVGALGGISLLVGCVGILTVMIIAVRERTAETGLLRAIGATRRQVLIIFLVKRSCWPTWDMRSGSRYFPRIIPLRSTWRLRLTAAFSRRK